VLSANHFPDERGKPVLPSDILKKTFGDLVAHDFMDQISVTQTAVCKSLKETQRTDATHRPGLTVS